MRLLIMGPPGAGKGTQAQGIAARYEIPAISTGMIFRENITNRTALGEQIKRIISSGGYVPDELTLKVIFERLAADDCRNGWLLDGFPRTLGQVTALAERMAARGTHLDAVISITGNVDELVARMLKRAEIEGRADDNEETIRHRFQVYAEQTDPLLAHYREQGLLVEVDGMGSVEEVAERIAAALDAKLAAS